MKLNNICRTCLTEKKSMKLIFEASIPSMLMSCASIQVLEGDDLPNLICIQCIQILNRSYAFKQLCEKSDSTLRDHITNISIRNITLDEADTNNTYSDSIFSNDTSIFSHIFNNTNGHFEASTAVESDLAETMQSLQTIAEQCLPPTWDNVQNNITNNETSSDNACAEFSFDLYLKCQMCDEMFKDEWTRGEHTKSHSLQPPKYVSNVLYSKDCSNKVRSNNVDEPLLKLNIQEIHTNSITLKDIDLVHNQDNFSDYKKKYSCEICCKSYKERKLLIIHMRSHTGERPLSCDVCNKAFSLPSSLYKHKLTHTNYRKYKCNICDKGFTQESNLKMHIRTHTGEKPHICKICGKGCSTNVNLTIHIRTHTGVKPYRCTQCTNSFATGSQLKKHMLGHSGMKPYQCWQCGKSFRQKETRDTHVRYHSGERPHRCTFCTKKYIAASHLRVHMKTHTINKTLMPCL